MRKIFSWLKQIYHYCLALLAAIIYRFPSRQLVVIGVTGTKGKSTTVELIAKILEAGGYQTASSSTIQFRIGDRVIPNRRKMTMPGRFFIQRFLRQAARRGATHVVLEMTSEGVRQHRHRWINLNVLVFTNLHPEHIEAHGSFEAYRRAKLLLAQALAKSPKHNRALVVNGDDHEAGAFLAHHVPQKIIFKLADAAPYNITDTQTTLTINGLTINSPLSGKFNAENILAAAAVGKLFGVLPETIKQTVESISGIRGRMERIEHHGRTVIVDYAHTPESLKKVYETFAGQSKICVLGNCGGGRDRWKRPVMAKIAEEFCQWVILTNEDPYDENPENILQEMSHGFSRANHELILDRRLAIRRAIELVTPKGIVIITGKGSDPFIMEADGKRLPWDDATVAREELNRYA